MHEINCNVIRDLLPGYVDGLASEDSRALVQEHVETCESCRAALEAMRAPEPAPAAEKKEIDFLKKNRRRNRRILLWSVAGALALAFLVLAARAFVVGSNGEPGWLYCEPAVDGSVLTLKAAPLDSAGAVAGMKFSENDGVVTVTTRHVVASPLHRGAAEETFTASEPVRRVIVNDRVVWDDGAYISSFTAQVWAARHPYTGDASAKRALGRQLLQGEFTSELETEAEPYGWILRLQEGTEPASRADLRSAAYALIAMVQNLDHVTFAWTSGGTEQRFTVTAAEATAFLREQIPATTTTVAGKDGAALNIKDCYDSPALLQLLLQTTGLRGPVILSGPAAAADRTVTVVNGTDLEIFCMELAAYRGDEITSSETGMYADESAIPFGASMDFTVSAGSAALGYDYRLTVTTMDGKQITPANSVDITAAQLTLRGSEADGYTLEP